MDSKQKRGYAIADFERGMVLKLDKKVCSAMDISARRSAQMGISMREKIARFMQGRYGAYGTDSLNRFLLAGALVSMLLSIFTGWDLLYLLALAALVFSYFRIFSRNYTKRYAENQLFLKKTEGIRRFFATQKNVMRQRKTHHIYKCPNCRQKIRIPKGKGKIAVKCPKCGTEFIKLS